MTHVVLSRPSIRAAMLCMTLGGATFLAGCGVFEPAPPPVEQPRPGLFGTNGVVDLKVGVVIGKDKQLDLEKGEIGLHSTPTVVNDTVIVGSSMFEGLGYRYSTNAKGLVRAFDVKTGKQIWRFNTIPGPGEFGNDTWENGSWEWTGNVGVWTQISADPAAGLVYLPSFIVGEDLQAGRLVSVLEEFTMVGATVNAVYPHARHLSPKVRVFVDFLAERFGPQPYWDAPRMAARPEGSTT